MLRRVLSLALMVACAWSWFILGVTLALAVPGLLLLSALGSSLILSGAVLFDRHLDRTYRRTCRTCSFWGRTLREIRELPERAAE